MATNKNLQSLEKLGGICTGFGDKFQPGQQKLQVNAMTTLLRQAETSVNNVYVAQTAYENATNHREVAFSGLAALSTRILGALIASGAQAQTVADARTMTRKLKGTQAIEKPTVPSVNASKEAATPPTAATRRARGRDFTSATGYFAKLIETLTSAPDYQPREADLQVAALRDKLASLHASNSEVMVSAETLRQARNQRDALVHGPTDSVYQVGQMTKQYVKSVFGYKSPNYAAVRKLRFTSKPL